MTTTLIKPFILCQRFGGVYNLIETEHYVKLWSPLKIQDRHNIQYTHNKVFSHQRIMYN